MAVRNAATSTLSKPRMAVRKRCCRTSSGLTFIRFSRSGLSVGAASENSGPHPDQRGAFLDGHLEVVAHAHGKLFQGVRSHAGRQETPSHIAQTAKVGAGVVRV